MELKFEEDLEKAAIPFFREKRLLCSWRVPLYDRVIDLVAIDKEGNLIGIEFKLRNWKRALEQVRTNLNAFDYGYVCLPGGNYLNRLLKKAKQLGIGVMIYNEDIRTIKIILEAQRVDPQWMPNVEYIKNHVKVRGISYCQ